MGGWAKTRLRGLGLVFQRNLKPNDKIEARLLLLAGTFVSIYTLALILAPAVRARSWGVDYPWTYSFGLLAWIFVFSLAHLRLSYVLPGRDPFILPIAALLSGWGLFNIWRLVPVLGMRQSVWVFISGLVLVLGLSASSDLGFLRRYKYLWLVGSLSLTAATLILGTNPLGYGPRMWLGCCGLYMQPSEPLKLLFITYLAAYMADREPYLALTRLRLLGHARTEPWPSFSTPLLPIIAPTLIVIGLALTLLVVQRDLGTASIFFLLYAAVLFSASGQKRILGATALALVFAAVAGYLSFDVVRLRVDAWLNPWLDPSGRSYQVVQSLISIAAGGLFGRGPGVGNPGLVPVAHSDLIYATIVEESGLVGAIALLAVLALLTARGLTISLRAANSYHRYLAVGLTLYLVGQSLLIISGSLRLLPLTGVTLPFVSYGGSSLLTSFLSITILLHISHYSSEAKVPSLAPGTSKNYLQIGLFLFMGLIAAALATGWWSIYRASNLLARTDNARRSIADRSVMRGSLLDRHGDPIQVTVGKPGEYARLSLYPDLGNVVGYTSPVYGQSGLEASLDSSLRGISGNPIASIWWKGLLYGQPPPGLDMRLTLDLELQETADDLLADHRGALIIMDARRGDILVMASHPTIDPNNLEEDWERLVEDPDSPFINRATGGQYAPGAALGPLLYAKAIEKVASYRGCHQ